MERDIQIVDIILSVNYIKKTPKSYLIVFKDGSELELTKSEYNERNEYFNNELDTLVKEEV